MFWAIAQCKLLKKSILPDLTYGTFESVVIAVIHESFCWIQGAPSSVMRSKQLLITGHSEMLRRINA
jgi:hypothetical protein